MALTLPDPEELDQFTLGASDIFSDDQKFEALKQAGVLLYLATNVTEDPTDEQIALTVSWGLMDMAFKILITRENQTEIYSPYSSETIGSYSYVKAAAAAIREGFMTGVEWFDIAVRALNGKASEGPMSVSSEHVFNQPYCESDPTPYVFPDVYGW